MDGKSGEFFFIEMNTRIQVEHPVTETVTGVDLVRLQLAVAAGGRLGLRQQDIVMKGHAIECRINAEDPQKAFMPSPGTVNDIRLPSGPGVRMDSHVYRGYKLPPYYDSLLGKLIVWDESRESHRPHAARAGRTGDRRREDDQGIPRTAHARRGFHRRQCQHPVRQGKAVRRPPHVPFALRR